MSALATPTPMIEPIIVCELDAGNRRPRSEVPHDRGDQQREYHREAGAAADLQDQLHRQQRDDAEGNRARDASTPSRLNIPDHTTAKFAGSERV